MWLKRQTTKSRNLAIYSASQVDRSIRIVLFAHSPFRGGAEYCLDTTLRELDRSRFEATVVFPNEGPMTESARSYGYRTVVEPLCHWLYWHKDGWYWRNLLGRSATHVRRLAKLIRQVDAEAVYTNTSAIFESALAARLAGIPHVWHVHEVLQNGSRIHQLLPLPLMKRMIYRLSDRIVFESHSARRVFEQSTPGDKSEVVYNSLRLDVVPDANVPATDRARFGLAPDDQVVGFVGQFIDRKNPLLLVRALRHVRNVSRLKCLLVGAGELEGALRSEIERLGLTEECRIAEFQEDISPVMRVIDVLALPSRQESFGLVLVEAASLGKPAIACRSEGPDEIIDDGKTGILIKQDDEASLAAAIERMLRSESERQAMGAAAAERAREMFCAKSNTTKLERVLLDVANAGYRQRRAVAWGQTGSRSVEGERPLTSRAAR